MSSLTPIEIDRSRIKELTDREEEWTLSVTHDDGSVDAYVDCFREMPSDLTS
jgi:hypothetical protein